MSGKLMRFSRALISLNYFPSKPRVLINQSICSSTRKFSITKRATITNFTSNFSRLRSTMSTEIPEVRSKPQNVDYNDLLAAQKDENILIIDVREQKEIDETGKLPGSIHIPMGNVAKILETLAADDFQKEYQKSKPQKDTKIILSCRSGMRSAKVQGELLTLGYQNAWNYTGGWSEWADKLKS